MTREREQLTRGTHAERLETVTLLLDGAPITTARAEQRLGYRLSGEHTAAIVWSDDALGDLDRVSDVLASAAGDSRPLTVLASAATRWVWVHGSPELDVLRAGVARFPAVRVALGSSGLDADGFRRSHLDAVTVQRMLARLASPQQLATHEEFDLVALLKTDTERADRFVRRTLGALTSDPEAVEALRAFIAAQCNATEAAAALYVHRNTLLRRLARAEKLLPRPLEHNLVHVGVALEVHRW
jgi:DNA-binding PucR family transcriptional regulator